MAANSPPFALTTDIDIGRLSTCVWPLIEVISGLKRVAIDPGRPSLLRLMLRPRILMVLPLTSIGVYGGMTVFS